MKPTELDRTSAEVLVDSRIRESVSWFNSKLSSEREKVMLYYNGELPKRQNPGSSSYISNEVYDGVESLKAQLLETFSAGNKIVRFDPENPQDVQAARVATRYTDYVFFRQNSGYQLLSSTIHDALTARVGIVKVYWDEKVDLVEHKFSRLSEDHVRGLATHEDIHSLEAEQDEDGTYKGKLVKSIDRSQVRIEPVNPEEFAIEAQAKGLDSDHFHVHSTIRTIDDLERDGYDISGLDEYDLGGETNFDYLPEVQARFSQVDTGIRPDNDKDDTATRHVLVHEAYIKLRMEGDEYAKLYQVVRAGKETLSFEEVDETPFVVFTPLPVPHSFYGNNFAHRIIPAQNVRTVLTRSIVDHATITNNPRYEVLKGGLINPKELLDNRLGGIVNVSKPGTIKPLEQAPLNPFVFQTLDLIKTQNEETTGISSLSQGLNKDAISKQNSAAMVDNLVSLSQIRQKVIARNLAYCFFVPLWTKIYNLVLLKESRKRVVELTGEWVEVDTARWRERRAVSVSLHLGYGDMDREAQKLIQFGTLVNQDPVLSQAFGLPQRYQLANDAAELQGISNVHAYPMPPEQVQPKGPDPITMAKVQNDGKKADAATLSAQAAMKKVDMHGEIEKMRATLAKMQQDIQNGFKEREEHRKDIDVMNKIDVSQREMKIAEATPPDGENINLVPH